LTQRILQRRRPAHVLPRFRHELPLRHRLVQLAEEARDVLAERGLERRVALRVTNFPIAPVVVCETDCINTMPARVARQPGLLITGAPALT